MTAFAAPRSLEGLRVKEGSRRMRRVCSLQFAYNSICGQDTRGRFLRGGVYQPIPVFGWRGNSEVGAHSPFTPRPGGGSCRYCSLM